VSYNIGIQNSYKYIHQIRCEPHLSDKARSEASRISITKIWYTYRKESERYCAMGQFNLCTKFTKILCDSSFYQVDLYIWTVL